mmetsp:Transcript_4841/g.8793  ORF Transcript_4841/g.8793 Transcript_4841/m.8793 type:complete len:542 (-) Transcript_4841:376-2001(-)
MKRQMSIIDAAVSANQKKTAAGKERTWTKNHPLEGDGLLVNFYNHMWKKNKDFQSCPGVRCPDTIVYDHNFPRGWYTYDQKNKEMKKKQGKELDTSSIYTAFSKAPDANVDIVAAYLWSYEQEKNGHTEAITSVEFFTKDDLTDFLNNRKTKREGILQRFLVPKGLNNSLIQAVWSPRVCIVQRKTNRYSISDRSYSAYERAVTYEGPSHYTEDGICAPKTTAQIKSICSNICQHFTNTEHKNITRMVLYFKVDKNDLVWLLWCGSVRISDRQHQSQMPLNLSPIFTSPDEHTKSHSNNSDDQDVLLDVDKHQYALSGDRIFYSTHCSPHSSPSKSQSQTRSGLPEVSVDMSAESIADRGSPVARKESIKEWYQQDNNIHEQYKQIAMEQDLVSQMLDDVFYEAYSHALRGPRGGFFFSLPMQIKHLLGAPELDKLLHHLGIRPAPVTEAASGDQPMPTPRAGDMEHDMMDLWIPDIRQTPINKLTSECQEYIKAVYSEREAALRKQAGFDTVPIMSVLDSSECTVPGNKSFSSVSFCANE